MAYGITSTTARITFPTPIPSGGTAALGVEWTFRLPRVEAGLRSTRMGRWTDSLYQVAQWYPRVAVHDDLREGGWDTDPVSRSLGVLQQFRPFRRETLDLPAGWARRRHRGWSRRRLCVVSRSLPPEQRSVRPPRFLRSSGSCVEHADPSALWTADTGPQITRASSPR